MPIGPKVRRFAKADLVLQLAEEMQATRSGISLSDIERRYAVSHRTAQRMRDAVARLHPEIETIIGDHKCSRWRIPSSRSAMIGISAIEASDLEFCIEILLKNNQRARARNIRMLLSRLLAAQPTEIIRRLEPDIEVLLEAEGLASRPGPRPIVRDEVIQVIRQALLMSCEIEIFHARRQDGQQASKRVQPLGFLLGARHYLVGIASRDENRTARLYALSGISKAFVTATTFERPVGFSLKDFAARSFGVYQEPPVSVTWRFSPAATPAAKEYVFHPRQETRLDKDGSLIVSFVAGGLMEMAWHLFTWGRDVTVLEPRQLQEMLKNAGHHSGFQIVLDKGKQTEKKESDQATYREEDHNSPTR